ncbi:hypothetical protein C8Q70DRAFT_478628 [Cubamyces menziesii]|nr:hypothetical protein C8Q70DRAFT_478628 [Cubamyces menziesii]
MGGRLETARLLRKSTSLVQIFLLSGFIACDVNAGAVIWPPTIACADNSWSWMYNSVGQSPCEAGQDLLQPCGGPSQATNNAPCYCNTVVYSLWAACVYCHGEGYSTFADYLSGGNCLDVSYGSILIAIAARSLATPQCLHGHINSILRQTTSLPFLTCKPRSRRPAVDH